jgi:hypothetical protein
VLDFAQPGGQERGEKGAGEGGDQAAFIGAGVRQNRQEIN